MRKKLIQNDLPFTKTDKSDAIVIIVTNHNGEKTVFRFNRFERSPNIVSNLKINPYF